jgi:predicted Zn-dependent protease
VEFRREVESVDDVCSGVDRQVRVRHVVPDEANAVGNRSLVDVRRDDGAPAIDECGRQLRSSSNGDFDEAIGPGEAIGEGFDTSFHGGMFKSGATLRISMLVAVVPVGEVPARVKRAASDALRSIYECDVRIYDSQSVPAGAFDANRNQYSAESFIQLAEEVGDGDKNIAVTDKDLFYRRRNYVFGLAYLDGSGSVVSTYRLQTSSDGGFSHKGSDEIFDDRVRKEIVHEVGHTMGLEHCDNKRCVMNFSPTVREVDMKEEHLCGSCQRKLF